MATRSRNPVVKSTSFETRVQSILQGLILAVVVWLGNTMIELVKSSSMQGLVNIQVAKDLTELKGEVVALRTQGTSAALTASTSAVAAALAAANAASEAALAASKAAMAASLAASDKESKKESGRTR